MLPGFLAGKHRPESDNVLHGLCIGSAADGKRRGKVSRLLPIGRQKALHDGAVFVLINAFFRVNGRKGEPVGLHCAAHRFGNMIGGSGFRMADIDRKPDEAVLHPQKSHIHRQRPAIGREMCIRDRACAVHGMDAEQFAAAFNARFATK